MAGMQRGASGGTDQGAYQLPTPVPPLDDPDVSFVLYVDQGTSYALRMDQAHSVTSYVDQQVSKDLYIENTQGTS